MTDEEIRAYLNAKDRWIALTTLGPDGFPHTVPLGYFLYGDDKVVLGCRDGTQKVANIERDSRVCLLWENGRGQSELIGIMIRGHARVVRDENERLEIKKEACRQRGEASPERVEPGVVYLEVSPVKTTSWKRPSRR